MNLQRPIIFFDLETTGTDVVNDRIIQIGAIKIAPNGEKEVKNVLVNPTVPIPQGASAVHGIYDKDVQDKPLFQQIAKSMLLWLQNCDLAGYNSDNFDIPLLAEEFARVDIEYPSQDCVYIDIIRIERLINSHKLGDTYKRYTGETLKDAHDALADVKATLRIFEHQVDQHDALNVSLTDLCKLYQDPDIQMVDFGRKIYLKGGQYYWNFGKHRNELIADSQSYAQWVMEKDFSRNTKMHLKRILGELNP